MEGDLCFLQGASSRTSSVRVTYQKAISRFTPRGPFRAFPSESALQATGKERLRRRSNTRDFGYQCWYECDAKDESACRLSHFCKMSSRYSQDLTVHRGVAANMSHRKMTSPNDCTEWLTTTQSVRNKLQPSSFVQSQSTTASLCSHHMGQVHSIFQAHIPSIATLCRVNATCA